MKQILKVLNKTVSAFMILSMLAISSCADLTDTNVDPNKLEAGQISAKFIMTKIIANSAYHNTNMIYGAGASNAMTLEAMQYLQRDYIESEVLNTFQWFPQSWGRYFYQHLTNAEYLISRAENETDRDFFTAVSLIMESYWYGYMTSAWGDIPYSEAMSADEGIFQPKYDAQKEVFKGILEDLEEANSLLTGTAVSDGTQSADILFGGNTLQWRQFANSLQLRYLMRLSEKTSDMGAIGVDVEGKFSAIVSNSSQYPIINNFEDNAAVGFPGVSKEDSWSGGINYFGNRSEFYRRKPASTIVDALKNTGDPRLTVWIRPVDVQIVEDANAVDGDEIRLDADGKVRRYISDVTGLDVDLYVGLPAAYPAPDAFNKNSPASINTIKDLDPSIYFEGAANPHTSYLADIYQENTHPLLKSVFISSTEVNFILAEAASRGWISGNAVDYYKTGITESLAQYDIADGDVKVYNTGTHLIDAFDQAAFIANAETAYNDASDKLEPILSQKWISLWFSGDSWFNWRRTGYPNLGANLISGPDGEKIPVRYAYGNTERSLNEANSDAAVGTLSPAVDDQWSKMWLIQGTNKPW